MNHVHMQRSEKVRGTWQRYGREEANLKSQFFQERQPSRHTSNAGIEGLVVEVDTSLGLIIKVHKDISTICHQGFTAGLEFLLHFREHM